MPTLESRIRAMEQATGMTTNRLAGAIELAPGQSPMDALAGAGVGMWFMSDADEDTAYLGEVRPDGTRKVHSPCD